MKKILLIANITILLFTLIGCSFEHKHDNGIDTKKPSYTTDREETCTYSNCEDTYTDSTTVIEDSIGSRSNPYSFDDIIQLDNITDLWGNYSGGATLKFSNYDDTNHTLKVEIELENNDGINSFRPFEDGAIIFTCVSSNYVELDYFYDTTDISKTDLLSSQSLSLYPGGKGHAFLYINDIEDLTDQPAYIVLYSGEKNNTITWIKLP